MKLFLIVAEELLIVEGLLLEDQPSGDGHGIAGGHRGGHVETGDEVVAEDDAEFNGAWGRLQRQRPCALVLGVVGGPEDLVVPTRLGAQLGMDGGPDPG